jgi:CheY-like chemotaxis protein
VRLLQATNDEHAFPMSALTGRILVLAYDDLHATELVAVLLAAGADTVVAANALEALQRLQQFKFDAAVIDCSPGAEGIAEQLGRRGVPFCVCGSTKASTSWKPAVVTRIDRVVPILAGLWAEGC